MSMVRVRRICAVAAATLLLLGLPGGTPATGQEAGTLFGYSMGATGTAISTLYNQPSFGVPTDPTFELRKVYSLAEIDSGPSAHALGSTLWPGQVIGNAPPSLAFDTLVFNPTQLKQLSDACAAGVPGFPLPLPTSAPEPFRCPGIDPFKRFMAEQTAGQAGYPVRAEAFHPSGPAEKTYDPVPGAHMQAAANEEIADATSTAARAEGVPGVISFGGLQSRSVSGVEKGVAFARSIVKVTDLDILGMVHLDQLLATAEATSDGQAGKTGGSLQLLGFTVAFPGRAPQQILVDDTGLHAGDGDQDGTEAKALLDALAKQGICIDLTKADNRRNRPEGCHIALYVGAPIKTVDGASASRSLAGLTLHLGAQGMNMLLDGLGRVAPDIAQTLRSPTSNALLAPLFQQGGLLSPTFAGLLASFFQGDQDMNFVFGSVAVNSAASPPFEEVVFPPLETPPFVSTPPLGDGSFGGGFSDGVGGTTPGGGGTLAIRPVAVVGVPVGLLGLILALAVFGAGRLRLFADRVMAAPAAVRCPLEES